MSRYPAFCPIHTSATHLCSWECAKRRSAFRVASDALRKYWKTPTTLARDYRGENNPKSRLRVVDIREIRDRSARGESYYKLARAFGVRHRTISSIVRRDAWQHVA